MFLSKFFYLGCIIGLVSYTLYTLKSVKVVTQTGPYKFIKDNNEVKIQYCIRTDHYFESKLSDKLHAWLYRPNIQKDSSAVRPVILMAVGLGTQKDFNIYVHYANLLCSNGIATFIFDYSHFGGSEGTPRNLIDPIKQRNEIKSAIDYIYNNNEINHLLNQTNNSARESLCLWGTSFAGGMVFLTYSDIKEEMAMGTPSPLIHCIIAHIPFLNKVSVLEHIQIRGIQNILSLLMLVILDKILSIIFKDISLNIPIASKMGTSVMKLSDTDYNEWENIRIRDEKSNLLNSWVNLTPARSLWNMLKHTNPTLKVEYVDIPILLLPAMRDCFLNITKVIEFAAKIDKKCANCTRILALDGGHFSFKAGNEIKKLIKEVSKFIYDSIYVNKSV
ncbi:hypothetical protein ACR3K2_30740 [Cryptosporidium serpentis]